MLPPGASELATKIISELEVFVFNRDIRDFFSAFYQEDFLVKWPLLDVVSDNALETYLSTTWHCDGPMKGLLKCFLYLNPVSEHGCNTLIIDEVRTRKLQSVNALPLELERRHTDISAFLQTLGLPETPIEFDLCAGDLLIFAPHKLAHRCLPPRAGKMRYTVCFSVFPESAFKCQIS
ncbi:hypothetical protein MACH26_34200 [Planctobacterium marinum]|uniref:Uncharacterized protein n=2 Tax=Planctobacterium marinum TaxID=1631968 RepID=A0AA48HMD7_9ALTE|nr:hypothetical protein MACH26_34200 [Planctobacterium marinum]